MTIDETQDIVHFKRGAEQMFGFAAAEVLGTPLNRLPVPVLADACVIDVVQESGALRLTGLAGHGGRPNGLPHPSG